MAFLPPLLFSQSNIKVGLILGGQVSDPSIAAEDAIFSHNGPRVSSIQAEGRYISYETYLVGAKKARETNYLCRQYSAQEALEMGLINKVVRCEKLDEEVDKWCEDILRASPCCIAIRKKSFDIQLDEEVAEKGSGVFRERLFPNWQGSAEATEGPRSFMERRPTNFWKLRKELGEGD